MLLKVPLEKASGLQLGHDITEVNPEKKVKRRAFKRGQILTDDDLERLRDLGKRSIFIWEDDGTEVHEDDAALTVAPLIAGDNIVFDSQPREGKISFRAACDGLFRVDVNRLYAINSLEIPSLPTVHSNFPVEQGKQVAAFRIIPLTCARTIVDQIIAKLATPLIEVKPYRVKKASIIVTGTEVYEGRIKNGFTSRLTRILEKFGVEVISSVVLPDAKDAISAAVRSAPASSDIVLVTGGTSVDPDDVTVHALREAGVVYEAKGNPIQPGNNFTVGYLGDVPVCAVPAAALHFKTTALNVFLPRLLAGEKIPREDFYRAGHGGLCHFCETCHFPLCPFATVA